MTTVAVQTTTAADRRGRVSSGTDEEGTATGVGGAGFTASAGGGGPGSVMDFRALASRFSWPLISTSTSSATRDKSATTRPAETAVSRTPSPIPVASRATLRNSGGGTNAEDTSSTSVVSSEPLPDCAEARTRGVAGGGALMASAGLTTAMGATAVGKENTIARTEDRTSDD